jgi:hypothetical protein
MEAGCSKAVLQIINEHKEVIMSSLCLNTPSHINPALRPSSNHQNKTFDWQDFLGNCQSMLFIRDVRDMVVLSQSIRMALSAGEVYWELAADDCQSVQAWVERLQASAKSLGWRGETPDQLIAEAQQSGVAITLLVTHAERCPDDVQDAMWMFMEQVQQGPVAFRLLLACQHEVWLSGNESESLLWWRVRADCVAVPDIMSKDRHHQQKQSESCRPMGEQLWHWFCGLPRWLRSTIGVLLLATMCYGSVQQWRAGPALTVQVQQWLSHIRAQTAIETSPVFAGHHGLHVAKSMFHAHLFTDSLS